MQVRFQKSIEVLFRSAVLIYFIISSFYFMQKIPGSGDELLFINDLDFIWNKGWIAAIEKNVSIPYMLLAYPFSFFLENYIALRLVNLLLLVVLCLYFYKQKEKYSGALFFYLLFFVSTVGYFFFGTNDILFFIGLVVFINETDNLETKGNWNGALAFSSLLIAFFTRELILVYTPVLLLCFYIIIRKKKLKNVKYQYPLVVFILLMLFNMPSIIANGKISYDLKSPPSSTNATWVQRQYLAQLMVNNGELPNYNHPSWEQTDAYLEKNGADSLPKGILGGLLFDVKLTIVEFFKDFYYTVFFGFRQLGLMLVIPLFFLVKDFFYTRKFNYSLLIPFSLWLMVSVFSLIIISFVELRWLAPVFILNIVYYGILHKNKKISENVVLSNYCILIAFSCYGFFSLFKKLTGTLI